MGRSEASNHRILKELIYENPSLLLPHIEPYIGKVSSEDVKAHMEFPLFNGDYKHPLTTSDLALEIRREQEERFYILVEVKSVPDNSKVLSRVMRDGRRQLRRNYSWSKEGMISFPKPEMMPLGIIVAGYPNYKISPVHFR